MRKEVLFAILAGSFLGLIIAFGIYRANSLIKPSENTDAKKEAGSSVQNVSLTIAKPENLDVVVSSPAEISGLTKASVWVVTSTDEDDLVTKSEADGSFKQSLDLTGGANPIVVTSLDPDDGVSQQKLLLVFSTEFAKNLSTPSPTSTPEGASSSSSDTIREKVIEKIEKAMLNPKAYLGTVTDKTEQTIQIKNLAGEIKQISINLDDTTVIKTSPQSREVKLTDIAIGDFIIAMGFTNGNSILEAKRILITPALNEADLAISLSRVKKALAKEVESQEISTDKTLKIIPGKVLSVSVLKNNKKSKAKFSDIAENDLIISVGQKSEAEVSARTIFILSE